MIPPFTSTGVLPPGIHVATWEDLTRQFANNTRRKEICEGLRRAALGLARAGCRRLWIDGSFVSARAIPSDWDGCWDPVGVAPALLDSVLLDFTPGGRHRMKTKYLADLFPSSIQEAQSGLLFVDYFQIDKVTGDLKGIVLLELARSIP